jgi:Zn-dependent protease with chaperone function
MKKMLKQFIFSVFIILSPEICLSNYDEFFDTETACKIAESTGSVKLETSTKSLGSISHEYCEILRESLEKISKIAGVYPRLLISTSSQINAFATSVNGQGVIGITFPMLEQLGSDRNLIAAIIGHEIAHLKLNHRASKVTNNAIFELLGVLAGVALDAKLGKSSPGFYGVGKDLGGLGSELAKMAYSREAETEADALSIEWMYLAEFDPDAAVLIHENILRASSSFFSSHPSSIDRITTIRETISRLKTSETSKIAAARKDENFSDPLSSEGKIPKGMVLSVNARHRYVVFSGTSRDQFFVGEDVGIAARNGGVVYAKVAKAIGGYYSAILPHFSDTVDKGAAVVAQKRGQQ